MSVSIPVAEPFTAAEAGVARTSLRRRHDAGWLIAWALFADVVLVPLHLLAPGVPGLAVSFALAAAVFMWWLAGSRGLSPTRVSWVVVAWGAFSAFAAASLLWSANPEYGVWKLAVFGALGFLPGLMARALVASGRSFSWRPSLWMGLVFLALALLTGHEVPEYPGRLTLPGGNPIWLGRAAVIAVVVVWRVSGWPAVVRISLGSIGGYLLFTSGSRGPMAAAVILLAFLAGLGVVHAVRHGRVGRPATVVAAVAILAILGAALGAFGPLEGITRNRIVTSLEAGQLEQDENVLSRRASLGSGLKAFAEHTGLGAGLGGLAPPSIREYPHNLLVEVAAELGVAGLFLFGLALWASMRARRGDGTGQILMAFCGLCALVSGDLGTNAALVAVAMAPPFRREESA